MWYLVDKETGEVEQLPAEESNFHIQDKDIATNTDKMQSWDGPQDVVIFIRE